MSTSKKDQADRKPSKGVFSMGPGTLEIPIELFELNRRRICEKLLQNGDQATKNATILLQGGELQPIYDTDIEYVFRQESFFMWAFGVHDVTGCYGAIHVSTGVSYLFVPRKTPEDIVWLGTLPTIDHYRKKYQIEQVHFVDELPDILKSLSNTLLTLNGVNSDSGLSNRPVHFQGIEQFQVKDDTLYHHMAACRLIKTEFEKEVMRYVARISSQAHKTVMKKAKPGMKEYQCESLFLHYAYDIGGCRHIAYPCICAAGENGAIGHYDSNTKIINDGDMCVFDMGSAYFGYSADITVSFPINGRFSQDQKLIYNAVLAANLAVQEAMKPGVYWNQMHLLANKVMLQQLKNIGIVKGDVDEMVEAGIAAVFQPAGLGHLLGLDVHDVGGYLEGTPSRSTKPGLRYLRTARKLQVGMALTIEPGCYFIDPVLDEALNDPAKKQYLNEEVLKRFRGFGGVRIEDDVFVTENGIENYTEVHRTVEEIENWMNGDEVNLSVRV